MRQLRALGFNAGKRGDLAISTVTARAFKESHPDWHLTLGLGPQYADVAPLFYQHPFFDNIHVWTSYDEWPSPADTAYLARAKYDHVFNPMPKVADGWWLAHHQTEALAVAHGLRPSRDRQCVLTRWFEPIKHDRAVAIAPFGDYTGATLTHKALPVALAQAITAYLCGAGWTVLQLGGPDEPALEGAVQVKTTYFDSVRTLLGCKALIMGDSGLSWMASAYSHPVLGLYSTSGYGVGRVAAIQPINPKAVYLSESTMDGFTLERVRPAIDALLS